MAPRKPATRSLATSRASSSSISGQTYKKNFDKVVDNIETVLKGKTEVVRLALTAIMCEGHILFEDVPGTGKTVLARAIAQSIDATTQRVQCTPDMLPGDITGSSIMNQRTLKFEFQAGPVFCNVLLADEINRATPKTQSSLLEAMAERRVSADGTTYDLPRPFLVLATQNPIEQAGTFPLPEAQLDRFLFKMSLGYMDRGAEFDVMFANSKQLSIEDLGPVTDTKEIQRMMEYASDIEVSDEVAYYIVDLVQASRTDANIAMGGSPRATINLLKASRALAASDGRNHVYPDDVRAVLPYIMAHRIVLNPDAILRGEDVSNVLDRVTNQVKPPISARK